MGTRGARSFRMDRRIVGLCASRAPVLGRREGLKIRAVDLEGFALGLRSYGLGCCGPGHGAGPCLRTPDASTAGAARHHGMQLPVHAAQARERATEHDKSPFLQETSYRQTPLFKPKHPSFLAG
jgi:hypothetical protein